MNECMQDIGSCQTNYCRDFHKYIPELKGLHRESDGVIIFHQSKCQEVALTKTFQMKIDGQKDVASEDKVVWESFHFQMIFWH